MENIYKQLVASLKDFKKQTGISRAVIGLSGGLDSAVVAVVAAEAFGPGNVFGVAMPSKYTSTLSNDTASVLAGNLGINFSVKPISDAVSLISTALKEDFSDGISSLTEQNLQSRIRGLILMAFANQLNAAVLPTGNKSEIYAGYCTLYGDTCGALALIGDLYKTEVYRLAEYINSTGEIIPRATIDRAPTAELAPGQLDSDSLPPYEELDIIIEEYVFNKKTPAEISKKFKIEKDAVVKAVARIEGTAFKRCQMAPVIRIKK